LKSQPKIAAAIALPTENSDLFEEGWEDALAKEEALLHAGPVQNGHTEAQAPSTEEEDE
jgi:coatomer subunit beta'